ncbi:PAS domain-containing hybrid sensor histidine kinase/response regulator [Phyllobacterium sp. CL33Tsu]|uniref:PAS domain-containing hybrid sensor histidine kinase/response regulator n=1 Tax=Phyllobacterium sp. CL33Tsu TaxID=1798191 RepID=UPI000B819BE5|nr:PAS domain-containing hybrid sensor histidine kinase/response regulator [Phyllobacterium sp. CL33Tsu]
MKILNDHVTRALIHAPMGRDAAVAAAILAEASIASEVCQSLDVLTSLLGESASFVVITEEAIRNADLKPLAAWVEVQPSWSDLPFIIVTHRGGGPERNPAAARLSEVLGNVTFLERPFHATTFVSVAKTALKARGRQYEALSRLEELREGEERLQTALLAGNLGTWELDFANNGLITSDVFRGIFGRSGDQALTYDDLIASIDPDDRQRVLTAIATTKGTGRDFQVEHRTVWPDGSAHWADARARVVSDRLGQPERLVGVCSDITNRKIAEAELVQLNETLEDRVFKRTRELEQAHRTLLDEIRQREVAEDQLRQAQKMEAIGQLTGGVAHDFNNLLMAVLGNLDLLRKSVADNSKAARLVDGALQGAQRGAALTQRLLAFARRQDLQLEPTDLVALVGGMHDLLAKSVGNGVHISYDVPDALPPVLADANQIELALLNLVVNSRDAMSDGGAVVVSLRRADIAATTDDLGAGDYIILGVSDTGLGMAPETLKRAIDPFFSTKELGKGTGLGLSMIHGLALQLKGALRMTSRLGKGTTAELWLPVTGAVKQAEPVSEEASTAGSGVRARILVVDDDALIAMSTVDMLEDLGHEVYEANSGADALKFLESGKEIDLLITDYSMPHMTGAELAESALSLNPQLPILVATGYADLPPGSGIDLPRLGKPYTQAELASQIAKALAK